MGAGRCTGLARFCVAAILACALTIGKGATWAETAPATGETATGPQTGPAQPAISDPPPAPGLKLETAPDCAARPDLLGISRIVEIDTATGPRFGDQYQQSETKFLEDHEIVLTFDDGPVRRYTLPILDALDAQCTKATFFSVGRMAIADPVTLQEVARRGHTIGSHTWSHKKLKLLGAEAMKYEVEMGLSAVAKAAGVPIAPFFRFPYLGDNKASLAYIQGRGLGTFGIHVDSKDFRTKSPGTVLKNVLAQLDHEKKGILLFHDIQPSTVGALASLLAELKTRGFKVVHMVPKQAPTTLPEFDAIAEKALKAKALAAAKDPMAERAMTWPVTGADGQEVAGPPPPPQARPVAPKRSARRSPAKPIDWANPSDDPWQIKVFGDQ